MSADKAAVAAEIEALHVFFDGWLSGRLPAATGLGRLEAALAPDFTMVTPAGARLDRAEVVGWLSAAHGARGPDFRIWITEPVLLARHGDTLLAGYIERQHIGGQDTARRASAVFLADAAGPNGLRWLLVHETWVAVPSG